MLLVVFSISRSPVTRVGAAVALLASAVLLRAVGPTLLWSVWNPYIIVLPFLALCVLWWLVATGEDRALPVAALFASFVTQTHVSLVPEAVALLAIAIA